MPPHRNGETLAFDQIEPVLDAGDFVQGLLCAGSLACVYGQSNSGKTFFATTLALHVAAGLPFAGRRVDRGGVLYCALESGFGFKNRVVVWRNEMALEDASIPFVATFRHINMLDPAQDLEAFATFVLDLTRVTGTPIKLVVIDTLARAMSGGNENAAEDMGALVMNADYLRQTTGACILFVHHSGKNQALGARGHSSLVAAVDTEIEVTVDDTKQHAATVLKQRDLDKGLAIGFALEIVELGRNPHDEPVTSCLVRFADGVPVTHAPLNGHQKRAFEILDDLLTRRGEPGWPGAPSGFFSVPEDWWRDNFYERALPGEKPDTKKRAFRRAADKLVELHRVGMNANRVWIVKRSTTSNGTSNGT